MAAGAVQMLQKSLLEAQKSLSSTDDAIKRLIGRDPNTRPPLRRSSGPGPEREMSNGGRMRAWSGSYDHPPPVKRRDTDGGRTRLSGRLGPPLREEREGPRRGEGGALSGRLGPPPLKEERDEGFRRGRGEGGMAFSGRLGPPRGGREEREGRMARRGEPDGGRIGPPRDREERDRGVRRGDGDRIDPPLREERDGRTARRGEPGRSRLADRLGPPPGKQDSGGEAEEEEEEEEEEERPRKRPLVQSSVIATKVPPRPTVTEVDENSKKRNRRMFGFLMGTLQKFKAAEETAKTSDKERRRQEITHKVEQIQEIEKEEAVQARKELFEQRKQQKSKIAHLAGQVATVSMYDEWNEHDKKLIGYIKTQAKPEIFYSPSEHTARTSKLLTETTATIEEKIKKRQEEVESLLTAEVKTTDGADEDEEKAEEPGVGEEVVQMDQGGGRRGEQANSDSGDGSD